MSQSIPSSTTDKTCKQAGTLGRFRQRHRNWIGFVFILPWLIGFVFLDAFPFLYNLYLSFTDYSVGGEGWTADWIGVANYVEMFTKDSNFAISVNNTLYYVAFSVPLGIIFAFSIALLLNTKIRGMPFFRTVYYLPSVVPLIATAIMFRQAFNTRYGLLNKALGLFGVKPLRWLSNPDLLKPSLIIMSLWGFGAMMIIYLASLQAIPKELYEALEIDGGGAWHKLRHITLPLMTPTIFFHLINGIINSFQVFVGAYVLFRGNWSPLSGGPLNKGLFYMLHVYKNAFSFFRMGYAAALSLVLFLAILVLTIILVRTQKRWVHYIAE